MPINKTVQSTVVTRLNHYAEKNHMTPIDRADVVHVGENGEIGLDAHTIVENAVGDQAAIQIHIGFAPHKRFPGLYLLTMFSVLHTAPAPKVRILLGHVFLRSRGARVADEFDLNSMVQRNCITIRSTAALDFVFSSYDAKAKWSNCAAVFNRDLK